MWSLWTKVFWRDALDRAARTFMQHAASTMLIGTFVGITGVPWLTVLNAAALGGVFSLVTSMAAGVAPVGDPGLPTAVRTHPSAPGKHALGAADNTAPV